MRLAVTLLVLAPLAAGCDKPCVVPAGTYEMTYSKLEGDCPPPIVTGFDGQTTEIEIEPGECRKWSHQHASPLSNEADSENDCQLVVNMSGQLTALGIEDGQASVSVRCTAPKTLTCRHLFSVEYRPKP